MGLFNKLFGKMTSQREQMEPKASGDLIRVVDVDGREMLISKDEWKRKVLPGTIEAAWNKPDDLYRVISDSMADGFWDVLGPAVDRLFEIDPLRNRATCAKGIFLMNLGKYNDAEILFKEYLEKFGDDGVVLTNLAKVHSKRHDDAGAESILFHALEFDPNQENGFNWYWAIAREKSGEAGGWKALERVSEIPGSWRAQIWLAKRELEAGKLDTAIGIYRSALARSGTVAPADLLKNISGELGKLGHLAAAIDLVEPRYDFHVHGIEVGNNLIKAHLELGQIDKARVIVGQLYAMNRPDWVPTLKYWDAEILRKTA